MGRKVKGWFAISGMEIYDGPAWEMNIAIRAKDIKCLMRCLDNIQTRLHENSASPRQLLKQVSSGVGSGENNFTERYDLQIRCSDEVEIIELRKRADELEANLKS